MSEDLNQPNPDYVTPPDGTYVGSGYDFKCKIYTRIVMQKGIAVPEGKCPGDGTPDDDGDYDPDEEDDD